MMQTTLRLGSALAALLAGWAMSPLAATPSAAQPPVYKDSEYARPVGQPLPRRREVMAPVDQACCAAAHGYHRPVNGGPGYVGSVRGLGRPSFDGLWPPVGYGSYRELPTD